MHFAMVAVKENNDVKNLIYLRRNDLRRNSLHYITYSYVKAHEVYTMQIFETLHGYLMTNATFGIM